MSPAGATSLEDQQYMEKLKQLSKYIEPLRRMINKIDKNEGRPESSNLLIIRVILPRKKTNFMNKFYTKNCWTDL